MPTDEVKSNQFGIHQNAQGDPPVTLMLDGNPSVATIAFKNDKPIVTMTITIQFNAAHIGVTDLKKDPEFFHNIIDFGDAVILSAPIEIKTEMDDENTIFHIGSQEITVQSNKDKFGAALANMKVNKEIGEQGTTAC